MRRTLALVLLTSLPVLGQVAAPTATGPAQQTAQPAQPSSTTDPDFEKAVVDWKSEAPANSPQLRERYPRYTLRAGDVIDLAFPFSPAFNQTVTVQPDGFITLKEGGDVHLSGLNVPQAREAIIKAYSGVLRDPKVDVTLKEFERPFFLATGELKNPGKFELRADLTVAQAVAVAGGFTESAKHSQVLVFRRFSPEQVEVRKINVKRMLAGADLSEDMYLRPGDMIYVPQSRISKLRSFIPKAMIGPTIRPRF